MHASRSSYYTSEHPQHNFERDAQRHLQHDYSSQHRPSHHPSHRSSYRPRHTLSIKDVEEILGPPVDHPSKHRTHTPSRAQPTPRSVIRTVPKAPADLRFVLREYHRITVPEACHLITHNNLDVWTKSGETYTQVDGRLVRAAIDRAAQKQRSFCTTFLTEQLRFTGERVAREKASLNELEPGSLVGIYHGDRNDRVVIVFNDGFNASI